MNRFGLLLVAILFMAAQTFAGYACKEHVILNKGDSCDLLTKPIKGCTSAKIFRKDELHEVNPTLECDNIRNNTKVCVTIDFVHSKPVKEYTIKKGDTCEKISDKLNVNIDILRNKNYGRFDCKRMKKYVGYVIEYYPNGVYVPNYLYSQEVDICDLE